MMSRRRWPLVVLAILLNVGGSPMAWAHAFAVPAAMDPEMPSDCAAHAESRITSDGQTSPGTLPCCDGGDCHCAAPPALASPAPSASPSALPAAPPGFLAPALPRLPLDDNLRPPIR
jgi:hypothetical protein